MDLANQISSMVIFFRICAAAKLAYYSFLCLYETPPPNLAILNAPAIRFVLSDMFQNLRSEDRGALLHLCLLSYLSDLEVE